MLTAELSRWEPIRTDTRRPTNFEQVSAELHTLQAFYLLADQEGLSLPEDSQRLRSRMLDLWNYLLSLQRRRAPWPPSELLSLIGLAQLHGLPTRLLDWSYNVSVATYFACVDAAREWTDLEALEAAGKLTQEQRERREKGRMVVWALNLYTATPRREERSQEALFVSVTAPGAGNPNLQAQQGVFTLDIPRLFKWDGDANLETIDEKILHHGGFTEPVCRRFQLEIRHATKLLTLLARERITGARFFPGYDGVIKDCGRESSEYAPAKPELTRYLTRARDRFCPA